MKLPWPSLARICAAMLAAAALAPATLARAVELGPAPLRFEPQDARDSIVLPKAALSRDDVAALYNASYLPGFSVPLQWTGSIAHFL